MHFSISSSLWLQLVKGADSTRLKYRYCVLFLFNKPHLCAVHQPHWRPQFSVFLFGPCTSSVNQSRHTQYCVSYHLLETAQLWKKLSYCFSPELVPSLFLPVLVAPMCCYLYVENDFVRFIGPIRLCLFVFVFETQRFLFQKFVTIRPMLKWNLLTCIIAKLNKCTASSTSAFLPRGMRKGSHSLLSMRRWRAVKQYSVAKVWETAWGKELETQKCFDRTTLSKGHKVIEHGYWGAAYTEGDGGRKAELWRMGESVDVYMEWMK